jgi:hypothetical protein
MTDKRSFEERSREFEVSLINEPIDYFAVKETARERANRRWGMKEEPEER